jgi:long-chain acyl-CoA synthetase
LVKAFVVPKPGVALDTEELLAQCRQNLAKYKVPSDIELRREIKLSALGKPLRRALREEFGDPCRKNSAGHGSPQDG